jgi:signal transduction histidine kinase/DNA-binding response OmpR family regulator
VNPFIEQLLKTGSGECEIGHVRRNGATFPAWMSCTVLTDADQKPCGFIGTALDITDRKWTQAVQDKLLARQQDINLLHQSLLEPIPLKEKLRKVTDGIVRIFDADFCRVWLIRPGDLCQGECIHAVAKDGPHVCRYRDRCLHLLASSGRYTHIDGQTHRRVPFGCYKIGRIASAEDHKFLTNDVPNDPRVHNHQWARELGLVSFAGYQIRDPDGYVLGVLALFAKHPVDESEDAMLEGLSATVALVVEEAAAQEALRQSKEEAENYVAALESANHALEASNQLAESANCAKSEFLANMSHEIRTPMTAILGYADLMLDENVGRTAREHVAVIKRNGEHLLGLISDILDLSKIETGKLQVEPIRCSPVQLVAEVVSLMRAQAAAKQLKLKTELAGPLPETVLTDPLRLRQVLVNLVGNAIKFTDQGEVRLAVRLNADRGCLSLCFDVTDTGIGMNEEQVGKLFKPFSQVDSSSTRKFSGTGLGLCISKHLAEALGGDIEVRSNPGKGSTFIVTINPGPLDGIQMIPNAQESLLDRPPTTTAAIPDKIVLHGRILLAEDGLDNQQLICMLLRRAGADVTAVENGQLAVEAAMSAREAGEPFNVILMDMQMPVMDGYTATQQLRKRGYTGPIVALTAHAMAEDCQKCLDAGCDDYLAKPIDWQKLLATVAPWAARGQTQNDSPDSSTSESQASTTTLPTFVYSHLAADPDVGKLVNRFVQTMPERINTLDAQAKSRDWNQLAETAHQIKGAAGSYGFDEITPYAVRLEAAARDAKREEQILSALDELLSLCRRVRSDKPQADETLLNTAVSVHRS